MDFPGAFFQLIGMFDYRVQGSTTLTVRAVGWKANDSLLGQDLHMPMVFLIPGMSSETIADLL